MDDRKVLLGVLGFALVLGCDVEEASLGDQASFRAAPKPDETSTVACGVSLITTKPTTAFTSGYGPTKDAALAMCESNYWTPAFVCRSGECRDAGGTGCEMEVSTSFEGVKIPKPQCECFYEWMGLIFDHDPFEPIDFEFPEEAFPPLPAPIIDGWPDCPGDNEIILGEQPCLPLAWAQTQVAAGLADSPAQALKQADDEGTWWCEGRVLLPKHVTLSCTQCCLDEVEE